METGDLGCLYCNHLANEHDEASEICLHAGCNCRRIIYSEEAMRPVLSPATMPVCAKCSHLVTAHHDLVGDSRLSSLMAIL